MPTDSQPAPSPAPAASEVRVARTGGFAGITKEGVVDLSSDDPRVPQVQQLVERIDLDKVQPSRPQPDRFVYVFRVASTEVQVQEQELTPELGELARLVLED